MEQPEESICRKCGHSVPSGNMVLHELRCAPPASPPTRLRFPSGSSMYPSANDDRNNDNTPYRHIRTSYGANIMPRSPSPASSAITLMDESDDDSDLTMYPPPDPEVVITGIRTARVASPALSVGSPGSASSTQWTCAVCTYDNQPGSADCEVCDAPRRAGGYPQQEHPRRSVRQRQPQQAAVGSPLPSGWDCPRCGRRVAQPLYGTHCITI